MINRRLHSLRSVSLLACILALAALAGCATDASAIESDSTVDALVDLGTTDEPSPGEDPDPTVDEPSTGLPRVVNNARTSAVHDSRTWVAGEPHPIPWHETSATAGNGADEPGTSADDSTEDSPLQQKPSSPAAGK